MTAKNELSEPHYPGRWASAAVRIGIPVEEYATAMQAGRKWCYACRSFHSRSFFRGNSSKADGLRSECIRCHQLQKYFQRGYCGYSRAINSQGLTTIIRVPVKKGGAS